MKILPWIIASASIGVVIYVMQDSPSAQLSGADNGLEGAANKRAWGTKQRVGGTGKRIAGNLKEGAGKLTGDKELEGKGFIDQAAGAARDTAGQAAHAVSDTLHDLTKG